MTEVPIASDGSGLRFIVIADSHIRPPDQEIDAYPSNALMVQRNEFVVDLCNQIDAAFVVHLGDIVHPLPVEDTHREAIDLAHGVYAKSLHPIHFVPGNHDVGTNRTRSWRSLPLPRATTPCMKMRGGRRSTRSTSGHATSSSSTHNS